MTGRRYACPNCMFRGTDDLEVNDGEQSLFIRCGRAFGRHIQAVSAIIVPFKTVRA